MKTTIQQLQRVGKIVGDCREWFNAVAEFSDDPEQLKEKLLECLQQDNDQEAQLQLAVNGRPLESSHERDESGRRHRAWIIPARYLQAGDNEIAVCREDSDKSLEFESVTVTQAAPVPHDTMDLSVPDPKPAAQLSLAVRLGAAFRPERDNWSYQVVGGRLNFRLLLARQAPENFTLGVAAAWPVRRKGLLEWLFEVWEKVQEKKQQLEDVLEKLTNRDDPRIAELRKALNDLDAYLQLHRNYLVKVLSGDSFQPAKALPVNPSLDLSLPMAQPVEPVVQFAQPVEPVVQFVQALADIPVVRPVERFPQDRPPQRERRVEPAPSKAKVGVNGAALGKLVVLAGMLVGAYLAYASYQRGEWTYEGLWAQVQAKLPAAATKGNEAKPPQNPPQNAQPNAPQNQNGFEQLLQQKNAGTGELQVSLCWSAKNDLDLHVFCPGGEIFYGNRQVAGGRLDVDMNVNYGSASTNAVENVFWTQAPKGHYKVVVHHYSNHGGQPGCQNPTPFQVRVVNHGNVQWFPGQVALHQSVTVYEFDVN